MNETKIKFEQDFNAGEDAGNHMMDSKYKMPESRLGMAPAVIQQVGLPLIHLYQQIPANTQIRKNQ